MRRIPIESEKAIMRRALEGATYRQLSREFGVSLATLNRIFEDARKETPNIDLLRGLSIMLRKNGSNVFDAIRGCKLLESLNKWGISLEELSDFTRLVERFLSEKGLEDDFITYAVRLVQLEQACGKSYHQVVKDFEKKLEETAGLDSTKIELEKQVRVLEADIKGSEEHLAEVNSEIEKATTAHEGLLKIGVNRLAKLVKFIQELESIGFDSRAMEKLSRALHVLERMNLDPDKLDKFVTERGPLEAQNIQLRLDNARLKDENTTLTQSNQSLLERDCALGTADRALKTRTVTVYCKRCGRPLPTALACQGYYQDLMNAGKPVAVLCPNCGPIMFNPQDIAFLFGWSLLPARDYETVTIEKPV